ncbi:MAG: hypothetical protein V1866_05030 [archaeon]
MAFDYLMAGPVVLVVVSLFILYKIFGDRYTASHGSAEAYKLAKEVGLNSWIGRLQSRWSALKQKRKEGKKEMREIKRDESLAKSENASPGEIQTEKASIADAKEAVNMESSNMALIAREERTYEITAAIEKIRKLVETYSQKTIHLDGVEEQELAQAGDLMLKFKSMTNYSEMDAQVTDFLKALHGRLVPIMESLVSNEESKEGYTRELVSQLKRTLGILKKVIKEAKTETNLFKRYEKKEFKSFRDEIKDLGKSVRSRKKSLGKLSRSNKAADRQILDKLAEEIRMLEDHYAKACNIRNQLRATEGVIKKDISLSRTTLKQAKGYDKKMASFDKALQKIEKKMEGRFKELRGSVEKLKKKLSEGAAGGDIYAASIALSSSLNEYYAINEKLTLLAADDFNKKMKDILAVSFQLAKCTETYSRLGSSLINSEKVMNQGAEMLTRIIESGTDNSKIRVEDEEIVRTLKGMGTILNDSANFEQELSKFITSIGYRINNLNPMIDRMFAEEKKIMDITKISSDSINSLISGLYQRKNKIHRDYFKKVQELGKGVVDAKDSAIRQQKMATSIGR